MVETAGFFTRARAALARALAPDLPQGMHGPEPAPAPGQTTKPGPELKREVAEAQLAGVRALHTETVASGLDPYRLASILLNCRNGDINAFLTLAEEIEERYPHYAAVLKTRKDALASIKPILADDEDGEVLPEVAEAVKELIEAPNFPDLAEDLSDALGKGFSVVEIMWEQRGGKWWPRDYVWKDPRYFTFDAVSRSTLRLAELGTIDGVDLAPGKFVRHLPRLKSGIPIRAGLAYSVAWMFLLASFTLKDWVQFMEVFGQPLRLGKYHPAATDAEKRSLLRAVTQIATDAGAIIPEGMTIEFIESKIGGQVPYESASRFFNEQVSKLVLGQTQTADHGSSLAQAKVHNEIRLEIKASDARKMGTTVNRDVIAWFVAFNFGSQAIAPRVEFPVPLPEDLKLLVEAIGVLVPLGLEVDQDEVREKFGLSHPGKGAKLLKAPEGAKPVTDRKALNTGPTLARAQVLYGAHVMGCQCGGCQNLGLARAGADDRDEIDELTEAAASEWEPQVMPMLAQIMAAAKAAGSYEEFQAALDQLQASLDTTGLEDALALDLMKAFVLGQLTVAK